MATILLLNGPNLNLLGQREPDVYGSEDLNSIETKLKQLAQQANHSLTCLQSNSESELIDAIHQAKGTIDFIIINPAGLSHTSVVLRDALLGVAIPFIEVHISNIYRRETFRHHSYLSDIAQGVISGLGTLGYQLALDAIIHELTERT